jgi:hypothetical protein
MHANQPARSREAGALYRAIQDFLGPIVLAVLLAVWRAWAGQMSHEG